MSEKELKDTLNLPKTDFPMKADLPRREPVLLENWRKLDIYRLIRDKKKGCPKYVLHDGPPYANGDIHTGHALNKTLKDFVVKFKSMTGYDSPYVPGWDCHGLPIEHQLFKELGINKYQISQVEFRKKAHDYAMKYVAKQKEQFQRLAVFGDWDDPYLTLAPSYEEAIIRSFGSLVSQGYVYRGLKPVNWCYRCETALAEAEVEYEDHTSPSVYVKFKVKGFKDDKLQKWFSALKQDVYLVIWTTTPWTLLANVAIAVHPKENYIFLRDASGRMHIIARGLKDKFLSVLGEKSGEYEEQDAGFAVPGMSLEGAVYGHPLLDRQGRVVNADYVSMEDGTGLVHTAPGHGNEDYLTGLKYKLDIIMPVDSKGNFDASTGEYKGLNVLDANKLIIQKLEEKGALVASAKIRHSYPHCWRCKNPVIFRATNQWFLGLDHQVKGSNRSFRDELLEQVREKVAWVPPAGRERISAMIQLRPDWCLSRQRYWGVPIPALICAECGEEFLDKTVIDKFAAYAAKEGSDSWFVRPAQDFCPEGLVCPKCKSGKFNKGSDILDVWFDSGASGQAVLKNRSQLNYPADLYLEGSDQHRGWFQSSLIVSTGVTRTPSFKSVLTHGFVVDGEGKKMSKSLGNVVSPFDILKKYGADIIRLWVASSGYNEDIRISDQILLRLSEAYRKIRNTIRFMLSNLFDFDPEKDRIAYESMRNIDRWILLRAQKMMISARDSYAAFEFQKAFKSIYDFCNEDLSVYYLDMVKGRLYTAGKDSSERRSAQTAIYETLNLLTRVIAPVLVFTAEETWQYIPKCRHDKDVPSVHLLDWPAENAVFLQQSAANAGAQTVEQLLGQVFALIPGITKLLEEKRVAGVIGSSFDAKINILTNNENRYKYLKGLEADLTEIFKVSQIFVSKTATSGQPVNPEFPDTCVEVSIAEGCKCIRCWNYSKQGSGSQESYLCEKCLKITEGKQ